MITFYCPSCWEVINEELKTCPNCGYVLDDFNKFEYEEKLLAALHHSVSERRIMAAQILGNRECEKALPEFLKIIESGETNYFFLRAVLQAATKISHPLSKTILKKAAKHESKLVSRLALALLDQISHNMEISEWDTHTG